VTAVLVDEYQGMVVSASRDGTVRLFALESGRALGTLDKQMGPVLCLCNLSVGLLACGTSDGDVWLWDCEARACEGMLEGHRKKVLALHEGREKLVSSSSDGTIRVWSLADYTCEVVLKGYAGKLSPACVWSDRAAAEVQPRAALCSPVQRLGGGRWRRLLALWVCGAWPTASRCTCWRGTLHR